ncbi:MAG TPA: cellulase-like family protein [Bacteroidales bacterium]|nr:cellulase-like family protein [Bacteroidales bacterium]
MSTDRRSFIKQVSAGAGILAIPGTLSSYALQNSNQSTNKPLRVSTLQKPVAIAMWDFSWILRHHRYGEFENWDSILEGLAERGYNAVRIDAMPQFVAADTNGKHENEFRSVKNGWQPSLWGNDYTMSFRPREALLEFLPRCSKYGIKVGLATWFMQHGTNRKEIFKEEGGLLRAWDETLSFLKSNQLLNNVIYVDLLNEYPNWHGYDWLKKNMNRLSGLEQYKLDNPEANVPDQIISGKNSNAAQQKYYNDFIRSVIKTLKGKYPDLDFYASLDSSMELDRIDLSEFDALDYHIWFAHTGKIPGLDKVGARDQSLNYVEIYRDLQSYWKENKKSLVGWMEGRLNDISSYAARNNIVCGNTEGWGPISWFDHPELGWEWTKECAEICVDIARSHDNYKFICTSNFTHPQFKGMWEDISWHKKITERIKT